jgi:hypothetical protein
MLLYDYHFRIGGVDERDIGEREQVRFVTEKTA